MTMTPAPNMSDLAFGATRGVLGIPERSRTQRDLQHRQSELAHSARLSLLGELTTSIAHEVNQPLAAISINAAASLRWLDRAEPDLEETRALTRLILEDARRAADIVARVREMAVHRPPRAADLSINEVVSQAMTFLQHELHNHAVVLQLDLADPLPVTRADKTQLQQVIVNLAVNAIQAMQEAGPEERRLTVSSRLEGRDVVVEVADTGPGIDPEHMPRLFEGFFTTRQHGLGVGLSICRSILESHGGSISGRNLEDGGCCFEVRLPASAQLDQTDV